MLKGCQRRIIMVKDTGSPYFDSAYFVIKSGIPSSCRDSDMLTEAHKMIERYAKEEQKETIQQREASRKHRPSTAVWWGTLTACLIIFTLAAIIALKLIV